MLNSEAKKANENKLFDCGIYCITNIVNGKRYIGKTVRLKKRWTNHKSSLKYGVHHNTYFERSWNKYGEENFDYRVLLYCSPDMLSYYEPRAIHAYNTLDERYGYNFRDPDGEGSFRHSESSKKKISEALTGRKASQETKDRMSKARKGEKHGPMSEETKQKISNALKGRKGVSPSQETRDKISRTLLGPTNSWRGSHHSEESIQKMRNGQGSYEHRLKNAVARGARPFMVYKGGAIVGEWTIKIQCAREIGVSRTTIRTYLESGKICQAGYNFKYK